MTFVGLRGRRYFVRDWLILRGGYQAAKYNTFDKAQTWRNQITEHKFRAGSIGLYYNVNIDGKFLVGLAGGYQRTNNYGAFDEVSINQRYTGTNAAQDTARIIEKKITAGIGQFKAYNSDFLYADIARFFYKAGSKNFYALNLYYRTDKYLNSKYIQRAGIGAYLLNPKSGAINLGLFLEQTDWTNATDSDTKFGERVKIGATLKFPIGSVFVEPKAAKADTSEKK